MLLIHIKEDIRESRLASADVLFFSQTDSVSGIFIRTHSQRQTALFADSPAFRDLIRTLNMINDSKDDMRHIRFAMFGKGQHGLIRLLAKPGTC